MDMCHAGYFWAYETKKHANKQPIIFTKNSHTFLMKSIMASALGASIPAILFYFALWDWKLNMHRFFSTPENITDKRFCKIFDQFPLLNFAITMHFVIVIIKWRDNFNSKPPKSKAIYWLWCDDLTPPSFTLNKKLQSFHKY